MVLNGKGLYEAAPIKNMLAGKETAHGTSYGLGEAGYDIRIKQDIHFKQVTNHANVRMDGPYVSVDGETYERGRFALASAIEEFRMPYNLTGIVHDKSTWARRGLSVFNTVIEPGWSGFLTLELVYHGEDELIIPAGAGIAQIMFHTLTHEAAYNGKYQNQEDRPVAARESV
ncbi:Deoxycytidine triphosphate deaminase [compost metagenome]